MYTKNKDIYPSPHVDISDVYQGIRIAQDFVSMIDVNL